MTPPAVGAWWLAELEIHRPIVLTDVRALRIAAGMQLVHVHEYYVRHGDQTFGVPGGLCLHNWPPTSINGGGDVRQRMFAEGDRVALVFFFSAKRDGDYDAQGYSVQYSELSNNGRADRRHPVVLTRSQVKVHMRLRSDAAALAAIGGPDCDPRNNPAQFVTP